MEINRINNTIMKRLTLVAGMLLLTVIFVALAQTCWADGPPPPPPGGGHGGGGNQPPGGGAPIDDGLPILLLAIGTYAAYRAKRMWWRKEEE
jgi:hypothetical protein